MIEPVAIAQSPVLSHSAWQSAFESIDDAIALVDTESGLLCAVTQQFNDLITTAHSGVSWQSVVAEHESARMAFEQFIASDKALNDSESANELMLGEQAYHIAFSKVHTTIIQIRLSPVKSEADGLFEYMQMRDSLFSTSRTISVSEMATTLAHELNTPIGTITNILRAIKMRLAQPETDLEALGAGLDKALDQARFTQNIISRIRDFTQSRRPQQQRLVLQDQIAEAVSLLDWLFTTRSCQVEMALPAEPIQVVGDATMLQQVYINLLRNAVDAMQGNSEPDSGVGAVSARQIHISLRKEKSNAIVAIADTGHGLGDSEELLFVPFATNKSNGMGVGLNICRSFVELHQGRLWLSPNDDSGCTSFIELPLAEKTDQAVKSTIHVAQDEGAL